MASCRDHQGVRFHQGQGQPAKNLACHLSLLEPFAPRQSTCQQLNLGDCTLVKAAQGLHSEWEEDPFLNIGAITPLGAAPASFAQQCPRCDNSSSEVGLHNSVTLGGVVHGMRKLWRLGCFINYTLQKKKMQYQYAPLTGVYKPDMKEFFS